MIDVFFLRPASGELMHPRVAVVSVHDCEQAVVLLEVLHESGAVAEARPARIRGTVAALVARRDAILDRQARAAAAGTRRAGLHLAGQG